MPIMLGSALRGLRRMKFKHGKVKYAVRFKPYKRAWVECWTPVWHEGRGPYLSIGLWFIAFFRGY